MTKDLPYPSAILLDWDGTVNDSMAVLHAAYNATRAHFQMVPIDYDRARNLTMHESRGSMLGLLEDQSKVDEGLKIFTDFLVSHHLDYLGKNEDGYYGTVPNVVEFLERARALEIPMAIVTNKRRFVFDSELDRLQWRDWFKFTVCANETLHNKPAGDPAILALKVLEIPTSKDVWFIGDTGSDMNCARAAGLTGIYIAPETPNPEWPCDVITNYESLTQRLESARV